MKTKEFIKEAEKLGYSANDDSIFINLFDGDNILLKVSKYDRYFLQTNFKWFAILYTEEKMNLFNLVYEYSKTPIIEREEDKKYLIEVPESWNWGKDVYFKLNSSTNILGGGNAKTSTQFTEKEIKYYHFENFKKVETKNE